VQRKTEESDGYTGVQVGFDAQEEERLPGPLQGHLENTWSLTEKGDCASFAWKTAKSYRMGITQAWVSLSLASGSMSSAPPRARASKVFTSATVRGPSHGSRFHDAPPDWFRSCRDHAGRVWKNQKMPGQHGNFRKTIQNLRVVQTRPDDNVILVSGDHSRRQGRFCDYPPSH